MLEQVNRSLGDSAGIVVGVGADAKRARDWGDLSQSLGFPRQYQHPAVAAAIAEILAVCKENKVACGYPHVEKDNVEEVVKEGFGWLMPRLVRSNAVLETGPKLLSR